MEHHQAIKRSSNHQRLFRWALWWGLGITIVSIALLFIPGLDDGQDPVGDLMYNLLGKGFWLLLLIVGIIMPVLEECTFRLWGNGKMATGIISSVLMSGFMLLYGWWAGLISLVATLGVTFLIKDRNRRLLAMMLLSSVLFMMAHTANYGGHFASTALALVEKFGFALLASYLVINHNLLWSICLHVANNSLACLAIYIGLATISPTTFSEEGKYDMTIRPLILEKNVELNYWPTGNGDTLTYNNNLDLMAINLLEWDSTHSYGYFYDTVVYYESSATHVKYNMQVVFAADKPHDYTAVVRTLERNEWIKLDTTVEQAYMITVLDSTKRIETDSTSTPMWVGAYTLQRDGLPILQPEGFNYYEWNVSSTRKLGSLDEARQLLEKAGLGLEPCDRKMTMIRITTLYDPLYDL